MTEPLSDARLTLVQVVEYRYVVHYYVEQIGPLPFSQS
jgi:hypothetical protein